MTSPYFLLLYTCYPQSYMPRPRRKVAFKHKLSLGNPSMNQNKDLRVCSDINLPDTAPETTKKRVRNPLCNDGTNELRDEEDSSSSESSDEDPQIIPILYPPTSNVDILWWDETTLDNPLRVGTIIEEGNETHAYKIQFRDGTTRYPTLREMDSRCIAHNKLVASDNELVVNRIQIALQEEVALQLAELTAHVRANRFQEARDHMISLSKQSIIRSSPSKALPETSSVGPQQGDVPCDLSSTTPLPEMTSPSCNGENEKN